jgi:uroporphyrinogen decarboxylase
MKASTQKLLVKIVEHEPEPDLIRLKSTLSRSETADRVPFMELFADAEVMATILRKPLNYFRKELTSLNEWEERSLSLIEFYEKLGYDYVRADTRDYEATVKTYKENRGQLAAGQVGSRSYRYRAIDSSPEMSRGDRLWANEDTGVIGNWEDYENFRWEDPVTIAEESNEGLKWVCDNVPTGMGVVTASGSILEPVMWLMGTKNFYLSIYKQPDLVDAMFQKITEINLARFKLAMMRRWVFPAHKKMAEMAHDRGSLYLLHSCGDLSKVMDDIIDEIRVDAKHSFEDNYMPVSEAKRLYGHRIGLIGGVDMDVLTRRTPSEVETYVSKILENCMPGGGYCLGTGNTVANYLPLDNYLTMLETGLSKGWYN